MSRVLVVDDDRIARELFTFILQAAGHEVHEANDGDNGLRAFEAVHPDVVVLDLFMPNMDGIETLLELRRRSATVRIIVVSAGWTPPARPGHPQPEIDLLASAEPLGASAALRKPVAPEDLVAAVARVTREPEDRERDETTG